VTAPSRTPKRERSFAPGLARFVVSYSTEPVASCAEHPVLSEFDKRLTIMSQWWFGPSTPWYDCNRSIGAMRSGPMPCSFRRLAQNSRLLS
jgi:hypothetical protein